MVQLAATRQVLVLCVAVSCESFGACFLLLPVATLWVRVVAATCSNPSGVRFLLQPVATLYVLACCYEPQQPARRACFMQPAMVDYG